MAFERIDTLERLLAQQTGLTREQIEAYRPDEAAAAQRGAAGRPG
ncbi:MAG: hypothetical protein U1F11_12075 [Steroidobacteraceae bacterium]